MSNLRISATSLTGRAMLGVAAAFVVCLAAAQSQVPPVGTARDDVPDERPQGEVPELIKATRNAILKFQISYGIEVEPDRTGKLVINNVENDSHAAHVGLKVGDRIVVINGRHLISPDHTADMLRHAVERQYHIVTVVREGRELEVILGKHIELLGMLIVPDASNRPVVLRVEFNSPAAMGGVQPDDILTGVSGRETETFHQFEEFTVPLVSKMSPGQELNLRVVRMARDAEITIIRPETLELPLVEIPEEHRQPRERRDPSAIIEQRVLPPRFNREYVREIMQLPPGVGGAVLFSDNGLTAIPEADSVVAVLHATHFDRVDTQGTERLNPTSRSPLPTDPNPPRRRGRIDPLEQPPATPQDQRQQESGQLPPPNAASAQQDDLHPERQTRQSPPEDAQAVETSPRARTQQRISRRLPDQDDSPLGAPTEPIPTEPGLPTDPRQPSQPFFHGDQIIGFVTVGIDATGPFVWARVSGLEQGRYQLAVHQFGDCGDIDQNSAGPIVAVLGVLTADERGRAELRRPLDSGIEPSQLVGRAVSLRGGQARAVRKIRGRPPIGNSDVLDEAEALRRRQAVDPRRQPTDQPQQSLENFPGALPDPNRGTIREREIPEAHVTQACGIFGFRSPLRTSR